MGGPNMGESANNDLVVFTHDFIAKAKEVYPNDTDLHIAIADGDYRTVKDKLYKYLCPGFDMSATKLISLQPDELYSQARTRIAQEELYDTCAMFLNSYWVVPAGKKT